MSSDFRVSSTYSSPEVGPEARFIVRTFNKKLSSRSVTLHLTIH